MSRGWDPPRCRHGRIILGCPHEDCPEQNEYLRKQDAAIRRWHRRQQEAARRMIRDILGLPAEDDR